MIAGAAATAQPCCVGVNPHDSLQYNIACTQTHGMGSQILTQKGFGRIAFGPASCNQCQACADKTFAKG